MAQEEQRRVLEVVWEGFSDAEIHEKLRKVFSLILEGELDHTGGSFDETSFGEQD
jgi:hypothetical protein